MEPMDESLPSQSVFVPSLAQPPPAAEAYGREKRIQSKAASGWSVPADNSSSNNMMDSNRSSSAPRARAGASPKPFLRKGSRREPSALHRVTSPPSSPEQAPGAATGSGFESSMWLQEERTRLDIDHREKASNGSAAMNAPLDESNFIDAIALNERMLAAKKEIDEFEYLERQLLEASHVSNVTGSLFAPSRISSDLVGMSLRLNESVRPTHFMPRATQLPIVEPEEVDPEDWDVGAARALQRGHSNSDDSYEETDISPVGRQSGRKERRDHEYSREASSDEVSDNGGNQGDDLEGESLRSLRKSWAGGASGISRDRLRSSGIGGSQHVDDSRSWGDVTAPPVHSTPFVQDEEERVQMGNMDFNVPSGIRGSAGSLPPRNHTPIRGYKSNMTSTQNTFAQTTAPTAVRRRPGSRPAKSPVMTRPTAISATTDSSALRDMGAELAEELAVYKKEIAAVKVIRKQQEAALADITAQKSKVLQWIAEEKEKTTSWCNEQRALIAKERRNAMAKHARESTATAGQGADTPLSRRDRVEIQALQATIEKMKLDHEALRKKSKMNDNRLQQLIRDQNDIISGLEKKVDTLQREKDLYEAWIQESDLQEYFEASSAKRIQPIGAPSGKAMRKGGSDAGPRIVSAVGVVEPKGKRLPTKKNSTMNSTTYAEEVFLFDETSRSAVNQGRDLYAGQRADEDLGYPDDLVNGFQSAGEESSEHSEAIDVNIGFNRDGVNVSETKNRYSSSPKSTLGASASGLVQASRTNASDDIVNIGTGTVGLHSTLNSAVSGENPVAQSHGRALLSIIGEADEFRRSHEPDAKNLYRSRDVEDSIDVERKRHGAVSSSRTRDDASTARDEVATSSGRVETIDKSGTRIISYRNGTVKEVHTDGSQYIKFSNGDTKRQLPLNKCDMASKLLQAQLRILSKTREKQLIGMQRRGKAGLGSVVGGENYLLMGLHEGGPFETLVQQSTGFGKDDVVIVVYYYKKAQTTHTSFPDGLEVYEFPNQQIEHHFPNGEKLITFSDGTTKAMLSSGIQESIFPDGVVVREYPDGSREVL